MLLIALVFCEILFWVLFVFVLVLWPILYVSLDCPCFEVRSVFLHVYLILVLISLIYSYYNHICKKSYDLEYM